MDTISFTDFKKLHIVTGTIVEVTIPEGSEKILRLIIDCGEQLGKRVIFAGLKPFFTLEELMGKQVLVLVNLEPKMFFGEEGQGMLLAVGDEKPVLLSPLNPVDNGVTVR